MKKRLCVLIFFAALLSLCLGACSNKDIYSELQGKGYNIIISYECNGGAFNNNSNVSVETMYKVSDGQSTFIAPPTKDNMGASIMLSKSGHFLEGWYTDAALTDKWDFSTDKTDSSMKLYAKWLQNFRYEVYAVDANQVQSLVESVEVAQGGVYPSFGVDPVRQGYTFLRKWYADSACTVEFDPSHTHGGTVVNGELSAQVEKIYTRWIQGEYKLVESPSDLTSISAVGNYYLMNDIDFTGRYWTGSNVHFSGKFIGNGHTIKGINLFYGLNPYTNTMPPDYDTKLDPLNYIGTLIGSQETHAGLFASISSQAVFEKIRFDDINLHINYSLTKNEKYVGLLSGIVQKDATFTDMQINGKITIQKLPDNAESTFNLGYFAGKLGEANFQNYMQNIVFENLTENMLLSQNATNPNTIDIVKKVL